MPASMKAIRPLKDKTENDLLSTCAKILAKPGWSRQDYHDLMAINWELQMRELLKAKPSRSSGLITGRTQ